MGINTDGNKSTMRQSYIENVNENEGTSKNIEKDIPIL